LKKSSTIIFIVVIFAYFHQYIYSGSLLLQKIQININLFLYK